MWWHGCEIHSRFASLRSSFVFLTAYRPEAAIKIYGQTIDIGYFKHYIFLPKRNYRALGRRSTCENQPMFRLNVRLRSI